MRKLSGISCSPFLLETGESIANLPRTSNKSTTYPSRVTPKDGRGLKFIYHGRVLLVASLHTLLARIAEYCAAETLNISCSCNYGLGGCTETLGTEHVTGEAVGELLKVIFGSTLIHIV